MMPPDLNITENGNPSQQITIHTLKNIFSLLSFLWFSKNVNLHLIFYMPSQCPETLSQSTRYNWVPLTLSQNILQRKKSYLPKEQNAEATCKILINVLIHSVTHTQLQPYYFLLCFLCLAVMRCKEQDLPVTCTGVYVSYSLDPNYIFSYYYMQTFNY